VDTALTLGDRDALDAVDADYGGMPIYLERELRVGEAERRRLEALYLVS
jgi:hypothetical protein